MNRCEFIEYDSKMKDVREALLKDNIALDICRNDIHISVIKDIMENEEIQGFIAMVDGKYAGFVFFKNEYDTIYLSLIATKSK